MRVAVKNLDLALWKTRNIVFFVGVIAMNYTLMRPSPVDLIFLATLALCLVVNQEIRINFIAFTILILFWGLAFFYASIPQFNEPHVKFELLAKSFVLMIGLLACYVSTSWTARNYQAFLKVYVVSCVIASILGTIGFLTGSELLTWDARAKGLIDDPNMYGSFLLPAVLACIYLLHQRIGSRLLLIAALLVLALGVMLSFSRIAFVAMVACVVGYVVFINRLQLQRMVPTILALIVIGAVLAGIAFAVSEEFSQILLKRFTIAESYDLGREGRYGRYLLVLPMILDNPVGVGVLRLEKIFPEPIHNIFLSSFVNYGWLGGFTWLVLFGASIVLAIEDYRRTRDHLAVLLMFSFLSIVMCATLHEGEHWRHMWLFAGLLWGFSPANFPRTAMPRPSPKTTTPIAVRAMNVAGAIPRAATVPRSANLEASPIPRERINRSAPPPFPRARVRPT